MSSSSRANILSRIHAALGDIPRNTDVDAEYQSIERTYQSSGSLEPHDRLHLFIERLKEYGAAVHRSAPDEIAPLIAQLLVARESKSIVIPKDLPGEWLPPGFEFLPDHELTFRQLESCDGVITGCAVAIFDTGTIVLDAGSAQGRRALTLLPDYHLCVVFENQVHQTVPEAMRALATSISRPLTIISGPSATADIEMTRVQGVHGPRFMEVILVQS